MAAQPPFTRIYFDSEPLRTSGWPRISAQLNNLLSSITDPLPTFPLYLPAAVEDELEEQFLRDYNEASERFANLPRALNQMLARAALPALAPQAVPAIATIREAYRSRVNTIKGQWNLLPVSLTIRPMNEVFRMRLLRKRPFDADGDGLGDVLIYLSVIDHLLETPGEVGLLISADKDYEGADQLATEAGVHLITMPLDAALKAVKDRFNAAVREMVETSQAQSRQAVTDGLPALREFVEQTLEVPAAELAGFGEKLRRVDALNNLRIDGVLVSPTLGLVDVGQPVTFTVRLRVDIRATVERTIFPHRPSVKIGQSMDNQKPELLDILVNRAMAEPFEKTVTLNVEVEGTATKSAAGYNNLYWTSARLPKLSPSLEGLYAALRA